MKQITLELIENLMRPIIKMNNVLKFEALLDTGAELKSATTQVLKVSAVL